MFRYFFVITNLFLDCELVREYADFALFSFMYFEDFYGNKKQRILKYVSVTPEYT